ncbi:MAG: Flp family type IVb pilin [Actinomycetota bacterium]|nr:Flp family type IVb pilin [Actinomycetota bacterium]
MFISDLKARRDDRGASAVEYALLVTLIAAVIFTIVATVGTDLRAVFQNAADALPTTA